MENSSTGSHARLPVSCLCTMSHGKHYPAVTETLARTIEVFLHQSKLPAGVSAWWIIKRTLCGRWELSQKLLTRFLKMMTHGATAAERRLWWIRSNRNHLRGFCGFPIQSDSPARPLSKIPTQSKLPSQMFSFCIVTMISRPLKSAASVKLVIQDHLCHRCWSTVL